MNSYANQYHSSFTTNSPVRSFDLPFGLRTRRVHGGPYRERGKTGSFGVNVAAEIPLPADVHLRVKDFGVPRQNEMEDAIRETLWALAEGKEVYVGCMGGSGRTGTFLACLVKAVHPKIPDPVAWIRKNYKPSAVETRGQELFVDRFDVEGLQSIALQAKVVAAIKFWK